jgi:putative flippase GtrA
VISRNMLKFIVVSGTAAFANICSRVLFSLSLPYGIAIVCAFLVGLATAFALNRRYVFRDGTEPLPQQVFWFTVVNLAGLAQTLGVSLFLASIVLPRLGWTWHARDVAHMIGVAFPTVSSYFGHKYLSFRTKRTING